MIKDLNVKRKPLKYYAEELQKVNFNEYPFDTFLVINEKSDLLQVEKLNSDREISWIAKNPSKMVKRFFTFHFLVMPP
jgi:hypothetical protein